MKAMNSTMHPQADHDTFAGTTILYNSKQNDVLAVPLANSSVNLQTPGAGTVPISGLSDILKNRYNSSTPSSDQNGYANGISTPSNSLLNGKDECDTPVSSGSYIHGGKEQSHAPSTSLTNAYGGGHNASQTVRLNGNINGVNTTTRGNPITEGNPPKLDTNGFSKGSINVHWQEGKSTISHNAKLSPHLESLQTQSPPASQSPSSSALPTNQAMGFRARSSIPSELAPEEFARQSILAADSSRLNPFALHSGEYKLLREHITPTQVTIYLNIRNAILRLWTRNSLVSVSLEEAVGCARETRYFEMAKVAYHWLMRNGYINFGCIDVHGPGNPASPAQSKESPQRTILVIGAGMSGLGCARQLEGLFAQLQHNWTDDGGIPPRVIVLEARPRIGGRVYSHPLYHQANSSLPPGHRCTAEMGAQIVTGFEHGNPMNAIIRGQLGIPYHGLRDNTILYDHDGTIVDRKQDALVETLYNDILERASVYRHKQAAFRTVEGDRHLMFFGLDPSDTGGSTIAALEDSNTPFPANRKIATSKKQEKPSSGVEKLAGRAYQLTAGFNPDISAAEAAKTMGWELKPGVFSKNSLDLDTVAKASEHPTLGETMDGGIAQYRAIVNLTPKDLRLLNWHHANLEYANAVNVNQLSLSGWDQDIGNEFEGEHTEIIGGYQQVPRGLWKCPETLDVRFSSVVKSINYDATETGASNPVRVECKNGEVFEADKLIITTPLGVLKDKSIEFNPPLPYWKQAVIERMGFGLLNKIVLVYDEPFWEVDRDMFGLLNEAEHASSLDEKDYATRRGRFYLFWNCIKTSGRPVLIALMAGDAAHYAENTTDESLIREVTDQLTKMFVSTPVPLPTETIVTRWKKDPFARGSYSYVGPRTQAGDYDVMARSHGPLYFAGEATCGTHPATVHGAYLSGLRAAAEVINSLIGPITVPTPLIEKKAKMERAPRASIESKKRLSDAVQPASRPARQFRDDDYEANITTAILNEIGERPLKPNRVGVNPFLLYTKDFWHSCKAECDKARKTATGDPNAKASKTEIRTALGQMWRNAPADVKKPYLDQTQNARDASALVAEQYAQLVAEWDRNAQRIREEYIQQHPAPEGSELNAHAATGQAGTKRLRRI